jgi:hypothetical protein
MPRKLIDLPPHIRKKLEEERGTEAPNFFEERRCPRFRCHSSGVAKLLSSPIENELQSEDEFVIISNLSRSGLGLFAHQQWFPEQVFRVEFDVATFVARVARVRRITDRCYEVGLQICTLEDRKDVP